MVYGLVITDEGHTSDSPTHLVLLMDRNYTSIRDFQLHAVLHQIKKADLLNYARSEEGYREYYKPLHFGDVLKWDKSEQFLFSDVYEKFAPTYKTRIRNGETQILLTGIVSSNQRTFWMLDIFPNLPIPYNLQNQTIPNVAIKAWITIQIMPRILLKYELSEYVEPDLELQYRVRLAPWLVLSRNVREMNVEMISNMIGEVRKNDNTKTNSDVWVPLPNETLSGIEGIVISKTAIVCLKYPETYFRKIVCNENQFLPPVGSRVIFNAEWLNFIGIYSVSSAKIDNKTNLKPIGVSPSGDMRTTIKMVPDLPGFFKSEALNCYVDDPENLLEPWIFSKYSKGTLSVAIRDGPPSSTGKARIFVTDITDQKAAKIQAAKEAGEMIIINEQCVVVDEIGNLHFVKYPNLKIKLPKSEKYPIGTILKVDASNNGKKWELNQVKIDNSTPKIEWARQFNTIKTKEIILFKLTEVVGCRELPHLLYHQLFGIIQTPLLFRAPKFAHHYKYRNVWVSMANSHPYDVLLPPNKFEYVCYGDLNTKQVEQLEGKIKKNYFESKENKNKPIEKWIEEARNEIEPVPAKPFFSEEELNNQNQNLDIPKMITEIMNLDEWKKNPTEKVKKEVENHEKECSSCRQRIFDEKCLFPEILACLLERENSIVKFLMERDLLTFIVARRFKK